MDDPACRNGIAGKLAGDAAAVLQIIGPDDKVPNGKPEIADGLGFEKEGDEGRHEHGGEALLVAGDSAAKGGMLAVHAAYTAIDPECQA